MQKAPGIVQGDQFPVVIGKEDVVSSQVGITPIGALKRNTGRGINENLPAFGADNNFQVYFDIRNLNGEFNLSPPFRIGSILCFNIGYH